MSEGRECWISIFFWRGDPRVQVTWGRPRRENAKEARVFTLPELATMKERLMQPCRWSAEDNAYVIQIGGIGAHGDTPEQAWAEWETALALVLEGKRAAGRREAFEEMRDELAGVTSGIYADQVINRLAGKG